MGSIQQQLFLSPRLLYFLKWSSKDAKYLGAETRRPNVAIADEQSDIWLPADPICAGFPQQTTYAIRHG